MRRLWRRIAIPAAVVASLLSFLIPAGVGGPSVASTSSAPPVLLAAGDIEGCTAGASTARVIKGVDGAVAALGDNAYPAGSNDDYAKCYDPTWGRFKDRTRPVPGNHDYDTPHAAGYFGYFAAAAGQPGRGYYSYDLGSWHVVALNSNCGAIDCAAERAWLDGDLSAHPAPCTLAYWHHPRFSSGSAGNNASLNTFWNVLYDHRASVVLSGHDHDYERFTAQDPTGRRDPGRGIRQFVVGTGGGALGSFFGHDANSEIRDSHTFGVLALTLRPDGYDWRFLPTPGGGFTDSGSDTCSGEVPPATTTTTRAGSVPTQPPPTPTTIRPAVDEIPAPISPTGRVDPPAERSPAESIRGRSVTTPASSRTGALGAPSASANRAARSPANVPSAILPDGPVAASSPAGNPLDATLPPEAGPELVAAISGLAEAPATQQPTGRRPLTLAAAVAVLVDSVALEMVRRRRGSGRGRSGRVAQYL
jgi:hypothetical protein